MYFFILCFMSRLKLSVPYESTNKDGEILNKIMLSTSIQLMLIKIDKNKNNSILTIDSMTFKIFQLINGILLENIKEKKIKLKEMFHLDIEDVIKVLMYLDNNEKYFDLIKSKIPMQKCDNSSEKITAYSLYANLMEHIVFPLQRDKLIKLRCLIYHTNLSYKIFISKEKETQINFVLMDNESNVSQFNSAKEQLNNLNKIVQTQQHPIDKHHKKSKNASLNETDTKLTIDFNYFRIDFHRNFQNLYLLDLGKENMIDFMSSLESKSNEYFRQIECELFNIISEKQKENVINGLKKEIEMFYITMCDPAEYEVFYSVFFAKKIFNIKSKNYIKAYMKKCHSAAILIALNAIFIANNIQSKENLNTKIDFNKCELYYISNLFNKKMRYCTFYLEFKKKPCAADYEITEISRVLLTYDVEFQAAFNDHKLLLSKNLVLYLISPYIRTF